MRRLICLFMIAMMAAGTAGCGKSTVESSAVESSAVETSAPSAPTASAEALPTIPLETAAPDSVLDLTALSSTMVYAEVFNIMSSPEEYVGRTIKMQGLFSRGKLYAGDGSLDDGGMVFACIIQDATACCAQGIPFDLEGEYSYPQDYPELGDPITVIGTFESHEQDGLQFYRLGNAELVR